MQGALHASVEVCWIQHVLAVTRGGTGYAQGLGSSAVGLSKVGLYLRCKDPGTQRRAGPIKPDLLQGLMGCLL